MLDTVPITAQKEQLRHKNTFWTVTRTVYIGLIILALLSHLWLIAINADIDSIPPFVWLLRLIPIPFTIIMGKLRKERGFKILLIYFCWFFLRCYISNPNSIFSKEVSSSALSALWLFFTCYGIGHVITGKHMDRCLMICLIIWILGVTALCCVGIKAAWTDKTIQMDRNGWIGYYVDPRLNLVYLPTTSGAVLGISILMATVGMISSKHKLGRLFFLVSIIPVLIALALTDSHTAYICTPVGLGVLIMAMVVHRRNNSAEGNVPVSKKDWMIGIIACIIISIVVFGIICGITPAFNTLKLRGVIPKAYAEGNGKMAVVNRGFNAGLLSGRTDVWKECIEYIKDHPTVFFIGETKQNPLRGFSDIYGHCHSIYLQVLLESGLPGLLLLILFMIHTGVSSFKVISSKTQPAWIKMLPAILVYLWLGDSVECFTWLRSSQCPMITILFVVAGIINIQRYNLEKDKYL